MKIFDVEVDFDFRDADDMEKFEKSYAETEKKIDEYKKSLERLDEKNVVQSEVIRAFCTIVSDFFIELFGKEATDKIFKGKSNYYTSLEAFKYVVDSKIEQETVAEEFIKDLSKYSPDRIKRD